MWQLKVTRLPLPTVQPNLYKNQPWGAGENGTQAYVAQWLNWTSSIDRAVNAVPGVRKSLPKRRWWVSSPTPLSTTPPLGPENIIPAGIDRNAQVAQYNPHGCTCGKEVFESEERR